MAMFQVLKRRRADGSPVIKVDQLRDGIVLFEDVAEAERYSSYMEADTSSQVGGGCCMCKVKLGICMFGLQAAVVCIASA